jgi:CRP/FNR family cyclic AMP-dependent transcriptional regulator
MRIVQTSQAERLHLLQTNPYFDQLQETSARRLAECVSLCQYGRGEMLFLECDPCAGLYILQEGCIELYRLSPQGRQYIVRLCQEGDTFNEVAVFDGKGNPVNAEAIEPSHTWVVEPECIRSMLASQPEFAQKVINNLGSNLRMLVRTASEMAFYQVTHRLARLISQVPPGDSTKGNALRLTQEQMAARLGTVREVVARSLCELERSGAILTVNRCITIADPSLLEQWIQGPWN